MSTTIKAYPLQWPAGFPRTQTREEGRFKTTLRDALTFLKSEIERMGGKGLVLSSNVTLGAERPPDSAVCAYFDWDGQAFAIPCDRWRKVEDNVRAIGLTIEAMRGMERWGAKHMIKAMFSGFKALEHRTQASWWETLEIDDPNTATEAEIMAKWRKKIAVHHPDKGGDAETFQQMNAAKDLGLSTIRSR